MPTEVRSPLLTSTISKEQLGKRTEPAFTALHGVIDRLGSIYSGLEGVRTNASPLKTAEAVALDYKAKHAAAFKRAEEFVKAQTNMLVDHEMSARTAAIKKAGLDTDSRMGSEIRSALRAMSQRERDNAIKASIDSGDANVIAALAHSPTPILTGTITVPVKSLVQQYVERQSPELGQELADTEKALQLLGLAWDSFQRASEKLRDRGAEARGEAGDTAARAADAELEAALGFAQ